MSNNNNFTFKSPTIIQANSSTVSSSSSSLSSSSSHNTIMPNLGKKPYINKPHENSLTTLVDNTTKIIQLTTSLLCTLNSQNDSNDRPLTLKDYMNLHRCSELDLKVNYIHGFYELDSSGIISNRIYAASAYESTILKLLNNNHYFIVKDVTVNTDILYYQYLPEVNFYVGAIYLKETSKILYVFIRTSLRGLTFIIWNNSIDDEDYNDIFRTLFLKDLQLTNQNKNYRHHKQKHFKLFKQSMERFIDNIKAQNLLTSL